MEKTIKHYIILEFNRKTTKKGITLDVKLDFHESESTYPKISFNSIYINWLENGKISRNLTFLLDENDQITNDKIYNELNNHYHILFAENAKNIEKFKKKVIKDLFDHLHGEYENNKIGFESFCSNICPHEKIEYNKEMRCCRMSNIIDREIKCYIEESRLLINFTPFNENFNRVSNQNCIYMLIKYLQNIIRYNYDMLLNDDL